MIKGFKWKQQDAAFVMERSEHMVRSCQTSQGSQVSQKIWDYIFHTGGGGEGVCGGAEGVVSLSIFGYPWKSLRVYLWLHSRRAVPRARLVTGLVV